jgi:hypothetical protein
MNRLAAEWSWTWLLINCFQDPRGNILLLILARILSVKQRFQQRALLQKLPQVLLAESWFLVIGKAA